MDTVDKKSSIDRLGLSSRSYNALRRSNIHTVGDLLDYPRHELNQLKHIGAKAAAEILEAIDRLEQAPVDQTLPQETVKPDFFAIEAFNDPLPELSDEQRAAIVADQRERLHTAVDIQDENRNRLRHTQTIQLPDYELTLHEIAVEVAVNIASVIPVKRDELYLHVVTYLETLAKAERLPVYEDESGKPLVRSLGRIHLFRASVKHMILAVLVRYPYGTYLENIVSDVPKPMADERFILECLGELRLTKRVIVTHEGNFRVNFKSVTDFVRTVPHPKHRLILTGRLEGKSLDEVGLELGLTRERIRQLQNKCFSEAPLFREDIYRLVFERYNINKQDFMMGFDEDEAVYNYLSVRYKRGKQDISGLMDDLHVPKRFREAGARIASQYFVTVNGEQIIATRTSIVNYLLRTSALESMHTGEFTALYDRFIERIGLDANPKIHGLDRAYFNRLANDRKVLWNHGNRLRYYDIDANDYKALFDGIKLQRFKNVEISAKKLFDEQPTLMADYDIRDEYELHNLLKKICSEGPYSHIVFRRMPHMHIGQVNRDKQVYDLLVESAPIEQEDFIELYSQRYGIHQQTILTNYLGSIEPYFYNGVYRFDIKVMPEEQQEKLRIHLTEDFYRTHTVEQIFTQLYPDEDPKQLNAYLYKLIGFNSYSEYVIRDTYTTASEYFQYILTAPDFIDSNSFPADLKQLNAYIVDLYRLRSNLNIIEYEAGKYVSSSYLEAHGINRKALNDFCDWVYETDDAEYFTMQSFLNRVVEPNPFAWDLDERFGAYFYTSIVISDSERFSYRRLGGNRIIRKNPTKFRLLDFIHALLKERKMTEASPEEIANILESDYSVVVPARSLPEFSEKGVATFI